MKQVMMIRVREDYRTVYARVVVDNDRFRIEVDKGRDWEQIPMPDTDHHAAVDKVIAEFDQRIQRLLEENNRLVERERAVKAEVRDLKATLRLLGKEE